MKCVLLQGKLASQQMNEECLRVTIICCKIPSQCIVSELFCCIVNR